MQNEYEIEIEETLQKVVKVKANSLDEAIDIVEEKYRNREYVLDSENFKGVKFSEYKDEIIKHKANQEYER